jgi:hypothetical protein
MGMRTGLLAIGVSEFQRIIGEDDQARSWDGEIREREAATGRVATATLDPLSSEFESELNPGPMALKGSASAGFCLFQRPSAMQCRR